MKTGRLRDDNVMRRLVNLTMTVGVGLLLTLPNAVLAQDPEQNGPPPELLLSNATSYYNTGSFKVQTNEGDPTNDFIEAIRYFNDFLTAVPEIAFDDSVSIYRKLADSYLQISMFAPTNGGTPQWEKTLEYFQWMLDRNPPDEEPSYNNFQAGWAKMQLEGYPSAMPYFETYLELRPEDLGNFMWVARIYLSLSNNNRACDLFLHVLENDPAFADGVGPTRTEILNLRSRLTLRYEEITLKLIELVPEVPQYLMDMARFKFDQARFDEGLDYLNQYLAMRSDDLFALSMLGSEHRRRGNWDEAVSAYRRILVIEPQRIDTICDIASVYFGQQRIGDTIREAKRALAIDANHPYANRVMGDAAVPWALEKFAEMYPDRELEKMMYDFRTLMKRIADDYYEKAKADPQHRSHANGQISYLSQFFPQPEDRFMWPQGQDYIIPFPPPRQ
ncbi:tetratricopeptide repeat protein [Gemmatimonadota bacterium]